MLCENESQIFPRGCVIASNRPSTVTLLGSFPYMLRTTLECCLVKEWKSGDEVIKTIESRGHQVLGIMTEQFQNSKHGNASVLEFAEGSLLRDFGCHVKLSKLEVTEETVVVNSSDEEEHLGPAEGRDRFQGSNTVRDIAAGKSGGDIERESEELWNHVSENSKLSNSSVLHRKD